MGKGGTAQGGQGHQEGLQKWQRKQSGVRCQVKPEQFGRDPVGRV